MSLKLELLEILDETPLTGLMSSTTWTFANIHFDIQFDEMQRGDRIDLPRHLIQMIIEELPCGKIKSYLDELLVRRPLKGRMHMYRGVPLAYSKEEVLDDWLRGDSVALKRSAVQEIIEEL